MKTFALLVVLGTLNVAARAADPMVLKDESSAKWGWTAFGHGLQDSGANASEGFYWVSVDWTTSAWGNGIYYKTGQAIDVTPYKKVSVKVSSQQPSKTKVQVELITADNAVLGTDPNSLYELKDGEETLIEADISKMVPIQAEQGQREFIPDQDLSKIDRVQIIFLKPDASETKNVLRFKDMKLLP